VSEPLDLGSGHTLRFTRWAPDRDLNPQYADLPDVDPIGAIETHPAPNGSPCEASLTFDSDVARRVFPNYPYWTVHCLDPLTLSPSLLCHQCGSHGFIRDGLWIAA
jgi:hypothetical protein